eukprot:352281-Chlamydomonas_euryale.AAC.1
MVKKACILPPRQSLRGTRAIGRQAGLAGTRGNAHEPQAAVHVKTCQRPRPFHAPWLVQTKPPWQHCVVASHNKAPKISPGSRTRAAAIPPPRPLHTFPPSTHMDSHGMLHGM